MGDIPEIFQHVPGLNSLKGETLADVKLPKPEEKKSQKKSSKKKPPTKK